MGDDAGNNRHEHEHGADPDNADSPVIRQIMQSIMHAVQRIAAARFSRLELLRRRLPTIHIQNLSTVFTITLAFLRRQRPVHRELIPAPRI